MTHSKVKRKVAFITVLALVVANTAGMTDATIGNVVNSGVSMVAEAATSISITDSDGYEEGAYVEWTGSTTDEYSVYYKKAGGSYTQIDSMLIRQYSGYFRADAVGLAAGTYTLKVVGKSSGEVETSTLTVTAFDRSGFSYQNSGADIGSGEYGCGGYTSSGTLASGAQVVYITKDTVNTVTLDVVTNAKGKTTTCTGLANILSARKKGYDLTPLVIRMVGEIQSSDIDGLNSNGYLEIKGCTNVTLEGIGNDATVYGWGLLVRDATNVEIKNLGVMLFPDDGISLDTDNTNVTVHNCDIFYGTAGSDADQAKGDGSIDVKTNSKYVTLSYNHFWDSGKSSLCGMTSESGENWITYHHNWFDHSDSRHPRIRTMSVHVYNNYYDGNSKYGVGTTLGSSAFVENNYFRNCNYPMLISLQGSDILAGGVFSSEAGGMIKSYGNYIEGAKSYITYQEDSSSFDAYEASSRDEQVPSTVTNSSGKTYNNFDTNSSVMYSYTADKAEDVPAIVTSKAGRVGGGDFSFTFDNSVDDTSHDLNTELMAKLKAYTSSVVAIGSGNFTSEVPTTTTTVTTASKDTTTTTAKTTTAAGGTTSSASGAVHNFTTDGTTSNFYTITGNMNSKDGSVSYNGLTLTKRLKLESSTSIGFTSSEGAVLTLVTDTATTIKLDGNKVDLDGSGVTQITLTAGSHTITKGTTGNLYLISVSGTESGDVTTAVTTTVAQGDTSATTTKATTQASSNPSVVVTDVIYCSPTGTGDGTTKDNPTDVLSAIENIPAGGVIYLLDGTYNFSETILIDENNCGTADAYKTIMAYPGDTVVWDFSAMAVDGANRGVVLDGDYWHFYGFEITKAGDNGMLLSGNYNVLEMMVFNNNQDTGLQISRYKTSNETIDTWPSYNTIKNCTSKNNCDDATMENADGFAAKLTCGEGNVFDGCMSYNNSDDGWDLFAKSATGPIGVVTIKNCIAFRNGYTEDGRGYGDCDGNGFKLGGSGVGSAHIVENCLAFENLHCGFTDNNNPKLESLTNCTAFNNDVGGDGKPNFSVYRCTDDGCDFSGIISYLNDSAVKKNNDKFVGTMVNSVFYNGGKYYNVTDKVDIANGDKTGDIVTLSDSDFVSVVAPEMGTDFHTLWRDADGSINVNGFMQLADSSSYAELGADFESYESVSVPAVPNGTETVVDGTVTTKPVADTSESGTVDTDDTQDSAPVATEITIVSAEVTDDNGDVVTDDDGSVVTVTYTQPVVVTSDTTTAADGEGEVGGSVATMFSNVTNEAGELVTDEEGSVVTVAVTQPVVSTTGGSVATTEAPKDTSESTTTTTSSGDSTGTATLRGDLNEDGQVNSVDLLLLKKYLLTMLSDDDLTDGGKANADVTGDGQIMANDLLKLKKYLLLMIDSLED
jgi:pectate lyase